MCTCNLKNCATIVSTAKVSWKLIKSWTGRKNVTVEFALVFKDFQQALLRSGLVDDKVCTLCIKTHATWRNMRHFFVRNSFLLSIASHNHICSSNEYIVRMRRLDTQSWPCTPQTWIRNDKISCRHISSGCVSICSRVLWGQSLARIGIVCACKSVSLFTMFDVSVCEMVAAKKT